MARKLRHITQAINAHLALRFGALDDVGKFGKKELPKMPAPVRVAALKGEARFRLAFFEFCNQKKIHDPDSQMKIWDRLVERQSMWIELCERSNLNKYSRELLPQITCMDYEARTKTLVFLLVDDFDAHSQNALEFVREILELYAGMITTVY